MARIKKSNQEEKKPIEGEKVKVEAKTQKKKKKEYSGSRWAALLVLIITLVMGVWFYIDGRGGWQGLKKETSGLFEGISWEKHYEWEK